MKKTITFEYEDFPVIEEVTDNLYEDIITMINNGKKVSRNSLARYFKTSQSRIRSILEKIESDGLAKSKSIKGKDVNGKINQIRIYYK